MPRRKDDPPELVTIKVRITEEFKEECTIARLSGPHKSNAESSFIRYLLELGLNKYKNIILPNELFDNDDTQKFGNSEIERLRAENSTPPGNGIIGPPPWVWARKPGVE